MSTQVITNRAGYFTFTGVPDGNVTIAPGGVSLSFAPESRTITINGADVSGQNFIGSSRFVSRTFGSSR